MFSNPYDCSAIYLEEALYEFDNGYFSIRHEDEIPDTIKMGRWELEDKSRKPRILASAMLLSPVTHCQACRVCYHEIKQSIWTGNMQKLAQNSAYKEKYYEKSAPSYEEIIVEKAIPFCRDHLRPGKAGSRQSFCLLLARIIISVLSVIVHLYTLHS